MPTPASPSKRANRKIQPFRMMIAGQAGLGKTTLLATLFPGLFKPDLEEVANNNDVPFDVIAPTQQIQSQTFVLNEVAIVEVLDTPGWSDSLGPEEVAKQCLEYLEAQFELALTEERQIKRNPKFEDPRVHLLLYLLDPTPRGIKLFDLQVMQQLMNRVNLFPLIAKADSFAPDQLKGLKELCLADLNSHQIRVVQFPDLEGVSLPLAVMGSVSPLSAEMGGKRGRPYPDRLAECDNPTQSDLPSLRSIIIDLYLDELRDSTKDVLYEQYRTEQLMQQTTIQ